LRIEIIFSHFRNKRDSIIAITTKVSHSYSFYI